MGWSRVGPSGPKHQVTEIFFELATAGGNHPLVAGMRVTFDVGLKLIEIGKKKIVNNQNVVQSNTNACNSSFRPLGSVSLPMYPLSFQGHALQMVPTE
ncbi:hypothetical protein VNO77_35773 [Canavalia gladiata]|uniref:Uncharacterized protein n=1 Tax=Canavalia gladiata TaxID=3824 RepID=A0AAN9PXB1_CANGL